jgi:ABC-type transporter Mla subunit MlaD
MEKYSSENNYFKIGIFVLIGLALIVLGLLSFGSDKLFQPTAYIETYFDESVQGISEGTPVKYRGLQIGYVKEISFVSEKYSAHGRSVARLQHRSIYVKIAVTSKMFTSLSKEALNDLLTNEVAAGLRIKLVPQGLTGTSFLELNYEEGKASAPRQLFWEPENFYVPSSTSTLTQLTDNIQVILEDLRQVDFKKIFATVENLSLSVNHVTEKFDSQITRLDEPLNKTMTNFKSLSDNLRTLTEQIKLYPSQIIFGGAPPPLNPEKL